MKVKNIILKICITVLISFLVFYKPIYSIFIFLAFYTEYLHFFIFVSKCFKYKKSNDYYIIKMVEIKNNEDSLYEIWNKINEINAFKKVYLCFLKKKKISIKSVIKNSIIILFGIPVRIIKICFFLWRSEYDTKTSLLQMYYENYFSAKELKIEFIDKKVYLNCSNR